MKLNEIVLENKEEVIIDHTRRKCERCGKDIFFAMSYKRDEKIVVELVGLAKWDVHKCQK